MTRKRTTTRRRPRQNVLEVRVMSPRLAWIGLLRLFGKLLKFACLLAAITAVGYGIWRGVQHAFHNNPDFELQLIDLNPNPVIDEIDLVELANIDLTAAPSVFDINAEYTRKQIEALPAVIEASVSRKMPGTLVVRVISRQPRAWITTTGSDISKLRQPGGMLVDSTGFVYPCPEKQAESSANLPVILVSPNEQYPVTSGELLEHPELNHCFNLLTAIRIADSQSTRWIESVRQANSWSIRLVTREGTSATFGLDEHSIQINKLRAALEHASSEGYQIDTINLIPKFNVPITVRGDEQQAPPRAIPVQEASIAPSTNSLSSLLQRH